MRFVIRKLGLLLAGVLAGHWVALWKFEPPLMEGEQA
jgi:hypothetical protein